MEGISKQYIYWALFNLTLRCSRYLGIEYLTVVGLKLPFAEDICKSVRLGGDEVLGLLDKHVQRALGGRPRVAQLQLQRHDEVAAAALLLLELLRLEVDSLTH